MAALSFLLLFPLAVPIAYALALRRRAKLRLKVPALRKRLERLAREVGGFEAIDGALARWRSKAWLWAAGVVVSSLVFSALWLGIARLAVSDPPEKPTSWIDASELGLHGRKLDTY